MGSSNILGGAFFFLLASSVAASETNGIEVALRNEFRSFLETGKAGSFLKNVAKELDLSDALRPSSDFDLRLEPEPKISVFCLTCAAGINEILTLSDKEDIVNRTIDLCIELGLGDYELCQGVILSNEPEVIYIVTHSPDVDGNDICGIIFVGQGCTSRNPDRIWEVALPPVTKPPVDEPPFPEPGVPTLKVLHLSDTHYDPLYVPGSDTQCGEVYLCCRAENGFPVDPADGAGFWGDYRNCDLPKWTLELIYSHIAETHPDIDFIIWTGDLVPHSVWDTSREENLAIIHEAANMLVNHFPGIPVYPAVGNHEADPVNLFPQPNIDDPEFDISWLYDELSAIWQTWLPVEAASSVAYAAYYSIEIRPGLKIISINTQYCYAWNWWLILDSTDIANQLSLMAQELQNAEDVGDRVYIIGHIPSGNQECELTWSHEFNRVVSRYENTVVGIFYGHTHKDEFALYFDPAEKERVYEVAYIAQSTTTYTNINPGYKIYTIEGDFNGSRYRVLDHENWILDLDAANNLNDTTLSKLYTAKDEYGLPDLSPQSWYDFVFQMDQPNSTLFDSYYRNYVKAGTPEMVKGCDEGCKGRILCNTFISDNSDHSKCELLNSLQ